jgi:hypothetical protein
VNWGSAFDLMGVWCHLPCPVWHVVEAAQGLDLPASEIRKDGTIADSIL